MAWKQKRDLERSDKYDVVTHTMVDGPPKCEINSYSTRRKGETAWRKWKNLVWHGRNSVNVYHRGGEVIVEVDL